ncbi:MAG: glycine cleavage system aminomethyltransferase GcvT [Chloroflexi bacterium]|nr:glycine cleavage system aminomethyltransferase GcvT [Chloroflexota bacterium]
MHLFKKTPLNKVHHDLKAKMGDFAGWELPMWFTSILEEHKAVRSGAGIFDVSDMGRIWVSGRKAGQFLDKVLTRPVSRLGIGSSQLCLMCLENGGILDDLWVYHVAVDEYLLVWNAGDTERKLDWLFRWSESDPDITFRNATDDTAMVAVQGPAVCQLGSMQAFCNLPRFGHARAKIDKFEVLGARTGYTGEDGFELISSAAEASPLWELLMRQDVKPCGLGARDTLRLEAGMMLSGQDMDPSTNPFEADLAWLVDFGKRDFVGKSSLLEISRQGIRRKLVGFKIKGREIARSGYFIFKSGQKLGKITSGGYAPSLGVSIGLGYVPVELSIVGTEIEILIRDKLVSAHIVNRRFYKKGG